MLTRKLIGLGIAWILASLAIAVVIAILFTELLRLVGLVQVGEPSHTIALNSVVLVAFIVLVSVPFVYRARFVDEKADDSS